MEQVTRFKTKDGALFTDETKAKRHEKLLADIAGLEKLVRADEKHDDCDFANGGGYKQLTPESVNKFIEGFGHLIEREMDGDTLHRYKQNPRGFVGRILCDSDTPLYGLWTILCRIDGQHRLWGQIYYANNPHEGKQISL